MLGAAVTGVGGEFGGPGGKPGERYPGWAGAANGGSTMNGRTRLWIGLCVAAAALTAGCAGSGSVNVEDEKARLLETDREFAAASLVHGAAEAFNMYLHDDAVMFTAGSHPVSGREAIYARMKEGDDGAELRWTPRDGDVAASGDIGWTWGEFVVVTREGGAESRTYGKYVNVWKKDGDGRWKVVADIGNPSPAPDERPAD
jgi:ketosteroid isomerase-like protein